MKAKITMGNDEFILYILKTSDCQIPNDQLGKMIWIWLRDNGGEKIEEDKPCLWSKVASDPNGMSLPKTAAQFKFDRSLLPELYNFLDQLKTQ